MLVGSQGFEPWTSRFSKVTRATTTACDYGSARPGRLVNQPKACRAGIPEVSWLLRPWRGACIFHRHHSCAETSAEFHCQTQAGHAGSDCEGPQAGDAEYSLNSPSIPKPKQAVGPSSPERFGRLDRGA
jgi:hypothetical protein